MTENVLLIRSGLAFTCLTQVVVTPAVVVNLLAVVAILAVSLIDTDQSPYRIGCRDAQCQH